MIKTVKLLIVFLVMLSWQSQTQALSYKQDIPAAAVGVSLGSATLWLMYAPNSEKIWKKIPGYGAFKNWEKRRGDSKALKIGRHVAKIAVTLSVTLLGGYLTRLGIKPGDVKETLNLADEPLDPVEEADLAPINSEGKKTSLELDLALKNLKKLYMERNNLLEKYNQSYRIYINGLGDYDEEFKRLSLEVLEKEAQAIQDHYHQYGPLIGLQQAGYNIPLEDSEEQREIIKKEREIQEIANGIFSNKGALPRRSFFFFNKTKAFLETYYFLYSESFDPNVLLYRSNQKFYSEENPLIFPHKSTRRLLADLYIKRIKCHQEGKPSEVAKNYQYFGENIDVLAFNNNFEDEEGLPLLRRPVLSALIQDKIRERFKYTIPTNE